MIGPGEQQVKSYFGEQRTGGGGVEPQWLMSRSPVSQAGSSTHWQHPPDSGLQLQGYVARAGIAVRCITTFLVHFGLVSSSKMVRVVLGI
jgi:hypothetical protein